MSDDRTFVEVMAELRDAWDGLVVASKTELLKILPVLVALYVLGAIVAVALAVS